MKTVTVVPCPFCRSINIQVFNTLLSNNAFVKCADCSCGGPPKVTTRSAIIAWNASKAGYKNYKTKLYLSNTQHFYSRKQP